jgi:hypothetical protein
MQYLLERWRASVIDPCAFRWPKLCSWDINNHLPFAQTDDLRGVAQGELFLVETA